jgi:hypothetical protein
VGVELPHYKKPFDKLRVIPLQKRKSEAYSVTVRP